MKTILVPVSGVDADAVALETAFSIARPLGAYVEGLGIRKGEDSLIWRAPLLEGAVGVVDAEALKILEDEDRLRVAHAHDTFTKACRKAGAAVSDAARPANEVAASWRVTQGSHIADLAAEARFHDLIVVERECLEVIDPFDLTSTVLGRLLLKAGRPVLLGGARPPRAPLKTVAIAWKDSAEAARAVTAALPLLAESEHVVVLSAIDSCDSPETCGVSRIVDYLGWHGVKAEWHDIVLEREKESAALLKAAHAVDADLLVMGAYGHSRLRESVFGGFTRHILNENPLPVFLCH